MNEASQQIEDGSAQLQQSEQTLADSKAQLDAGWNEYYAGQKALENLPTLNAALEQINQAEANLPAVQEGLAQLQSGLEQIQAQKTQLQPTYDQALQIKPELEKQLKQLEDQIASLPPDSELLDPLNQTKATLENSWHKLSK